MAASRVVERPQLQGGGSLIFVAVGTQLPFDRLIRAVDAWAGYRQRYDVVAQVGPTAYRATNIETFPFLDPKEFRRCVEEAELTVSHAGMGTIITALELGKNVVVMPRRAELLEHRNDHQLATARHFLVQGRIKVAFNESELVTELDKLRNDATPERIGEYASRPLIDALTAFLASESSGERLP
jgi:UDP-N-acetylglucosamine transferase subunit ALG13